MYIWLFSRSDGAGSATTRKIRGLTRSVIALIVPPFPAASRPSKMTMTRRPFSFTQSCNAHSLPCRRANSFRYFFSFIFFAGLSFFAIGSLSPLLLPAAAERAGQLGTRAQVGASRLRQFQLHLEEILIRRQDFEITGKTRVVPRSREVGS